MRVDRLASVVVIESPLHEDERGWFTYGFQASRVTESGADLAILQANHSFSRPNVLRGIHAEPWSKLIYVVSGHARLVIVDLDPGSAEFGMHMSVDCRADGRRGGLALYVPKGYGNGFYTFSGTHYMNFVSAEFTPVGRSGVRWDDPNLAIDWGNGSSRPVVSEADRGRMSLHDFALSRGASK